MSTINVEQPQQDSALADLTERAFESRQLVQDAHDWLAVRDIKRSGDIAHQNWKDARRLNGRSEKGESPVEEEMKINSPTVTHNYPQAEKKGKGSIIGPLVSLAAATVLGGSGLGAAWVVADALLSKPVATSTDTNSTLLQQFQDQNVEWAK